MAHIKIETEEKTAILTVDRPPVNALNAEVMKELDAAIDRVAGDPGVKAVILTGGGQKIFIAGADLKEIAKVGGRAEAERLAREGQRILTKLEELPKPVICAVNGICLGGGMELAMACHIRLASDRARFAQPEIALGMIPGFGGTQRLPRIVGWSKATELILTGDVLTPQEALRIGLVNAVIRDGALLKTARELAKKITQKGGRAIQAAMKALSEGRALPLAQSFANEARLFAALVETADFREGMNAFLEKRQPRFTDS